MFETLANLSTATYHLLRGTDLSDYFHGWPAGVSVAAICQASCGLCAAASPRHYV